MGGLQTTGVIIIIAVLVLIIFTILKKPIKIVFKLLLNTAIGFVALLILNWLGSFIGITIAVNWINAVIVGVLGVPGVALILLLQWLAVI
jgi:inhibitor of the pro-sigma K processing machinery